MRSRYLLAAGAVTLLAALAAYFSTQNPTSTVSQVMPTPTSLAFPSSLQDSDVLTWNCEIPEYKPESILLTCADGGWMVHSITWSKWGISGAEGTGIFREKLCEPNCAEGDVAEEKVEVSLTNLTERQGKFYLRTLDIKTASGKDFRSGRADGLEWDVMESSEIIGAN